MIFGMLNPEEIWHENLTDLSVYVSRTKRISSNGIFGNAARKWYGTRWLGSVANQSVRAIGRAADDWRSV